MCQPGPGNALPYREMRARSFKIQKKKILFPAVHQGQTKQVQDVFEEKMTEDEFDSLTKQQQIFAHLLLEIIAQIQSLKTVIGNA